MAEFDTSAAPLERRGGHFELEPLLGSYQLPPGTRVGASLETSLWHAAREAPGFLVRL